MPVYEFRCEKCGEKYEALCRMGEGASSQVCPNCGSKEVKKLFSRFRAMGTDGGGKSSCSSCSSTSCSTCR